MKTASIVAKPASPRFIDLEGQKFGRLTVLGFCGMKNKNSLWLCLCDCGNTCRTHSGNMKRGHSRSCGCLSDESRRAGTHGERKGQTRTVEYTCWRNMLTRCTNSNSQDFCNYGGRGITVYDRWLHSLENFLADMGRKPTPKHTIDRINNDGNYEPGNCRWVTRSVNCRNKRSNTLLKHNGETLTIAGWSDLFGITPETIIKRIKRGWEVSRAITTPSKSI